MDFKSAINKIMPDVQNGSTEPFIIYRDNIAGWQCDYTKNQYGETFDWVNEVKEKDPYALEYTGKDFANGSFPSVYDKVLSDRLRAEFNHNKDSEMYKMDTVESWFGGMEEEEANAFISFFEENVSGFSQVVTEYLAGVERPFAALCEICPINITMDREDGQAYNEEYAPRAIVCVEEGVRDRLHYIDTKKHMTLDDCVKDSHTADFTGKVIIVKANALMPEYRDPFSQLVLCTHGSGAKPNAKGRSIFCKELTSNKTVVYYRDEIEGIIKDDKIPRWAKTILAEMNAKKMSQKQEIAGKRKPSLLSSLDDAKAEATAHNVKSNSLPKTVKHGEMEV